MTGTLPSPSRMGVTDDMRDAVFAEMFSPTQPHLFVLQNYDALIGSDYAIPTRRQRNILRKPSKHKRPYKGSKAAKRASRGRR